MSERCTSHYTIGTMTDYCTFDAGHRGDHWGKHFNWRDYPAAPAMSVEKLREAEKKRASLALHWLDQMDQAGFVGGFEVRAGIRKWAEETLAVLAQEAEKPAAERSVSQLRKALERIAALPLGSHESKRIANIALAAQELRDENGATQPSSEQSPSLAQSTASAPEQKGASR